MVCRWCKRFLIVAGAVLLMAGAYDRFLMMHRVGGTDLEVEFVVVEASSGNRVQGARVEVKSDGGFYEEKEPQEFVLAVDAGGVARKVCRNTMCFGTGSGLGVTDTFAVHLPFWIFRVTAPGHESSQWIDLDVPAYGRQVRRVCPGQAKVVVPVSLAKSRD